MHCNVITVCKVLLIQTGLFIFSFDNSTAKFTTKYMKLEKMHLSEMIYLIVKVTSSCHCEQSIKEVYFKSRANGKIKRR